MRLLFLLLLLANLSGFAYIRYAESRAGADAQIALLQINPEKVKLLKPRGKDKAAAALPLSPPSPALACLEWGSFAAEDAPRAAAALARFDLADKLSQREVSDAGSSIFVIRDPGDAIAAKIAGLKADFPNAQLTATACADAPAAKNQ